jgi:TRAP-type mannitol/chloroaromatic compound transport system permease small subunit
MKTLLAGCRAIDRISAWFGWIAAACGLLACLISAGNAAVRYGLDDSSNAWLEIQWYLFAAMVMLGAAQVLQRNEHVRVYIVYSRLRGNWPIYVDLFGLVVFLMPVVLTLLCLSWPLFVNVLVSGERSSNAGGLIRWPAMLLLPLGFLLLGLQGAAEILKRVAMLRGQHALDAHYEKPLQ